MRLLVIESTAAHCPIALGGRPDKYQCGARAETWTCCGALPSMGGLCPVCMEQGAQEMIFVGTDVPTERT